jgi:hypothetical protein
MLRPGDDFQHLTRGALRLQDEAAPLTGMR